MRILWLTPQLPYPPHQGTTMRNFNLIAGMARRHTIRLCTFLAPGDELTPDSPLHALCDRIITLPQPQRTLAERAKSTLLSPLPDMALRLESSAMRATVQAQAAAFRPDIIQIEGIEMGRYGLDALAAASGGAGPSNKPGPALIFDNHNVEYLLQKRNALVDLTRPKRWVAGLYSLVQWAKLYRYERTLCRGADGIVAVSSVDRDALQALAPDRPVILLPNGMDLASIRPAPPPSSPPDTPDGPILLFTGKMDYRPNIDAALWFGQEVLPLVQARRPRVRFQIVGKSPHPRLDVLRTVPGVEITGPVPEIQPFVAGATLYVVPLRVGGGTRFKVLEALAGAKPLVSTSLGVEGLGLTSGRELLIGDTPQVFADHVLALLDDLDAGRPRPARLGQAGRRFVEENYDWDHLVPLLDALYRQVRGETP